MTSQALEPRVATWWERLLLAFVPSEVCIDPSEDLYVYYKLWRGRMYVVGYRTRGWPRERKG